jgi:hypothetical protein
MLPREQMATKTIINIDHQQSEIIPYFALRLCVLSGSIIKLRVEHSASVICPSFGKRKIGQRMAGIVDGLDRLLKYVSD